MMHHWYARLVPDRRDAAVALAARTYELTEYLVDVRRQPDLGARLDVDVTVHDACHGLRNLGIKGASRTLLAAAGAAVVEMTEPETCCGFGGVFATEFPEVSVDAGRRQARATRHGPSSRLAHEHRPRVPRCTSKAGGGAPAPARVRCTSPNCWRAGCPT